MARRVVYLTESQLRRFGMPSPIMLAVLIGSGPFGSGLRGLVEAMALCRPLHPLHAIFLLVPLVAVLVASVLSRRRALLDLAKGEG